MQPRTGFAVPADGVPALQPVTVCSDTCRDIQVGFVLLAGEMFRPDRHSAAACACCMRVCGVIQDSRTLVCVCCPALPGVVQGASTPFEEQPG